SFLHNHIRFLHLVNQFNPNYRALGRRKRLKTDHGTCHPLHTSMVLLYYIIKVFDLTDGDGRAVLLVIAFDRGFIGVTAVNRDRLGEPVAADRLLQKAQGGLCVPVLGEQKVNRLAVLIYRAVEITPLALHLDGGFVHAPADPHGTLAPMEGVLQLGTILHHPALDGRVVDRYPALFHKFFDMPIAQGIREIPAHAHENNLLRKVGPLAADRHRYSPSLLTMD